MDWNEQLYNDCDESIAMANGNYESECYEFMSEKIETLNKRIDDIEWEYENMKALTGIGGILTIIILSCVFTYICW